MPLASTVLLLFKVLMPLASCVEPVLKVLTPDLSAGI